MIKKVFHISDIHIRTFRMHGEYTIAFKKLFVKLRELSEGYDREEIRIVIGGDLVHQKITISNELILMVTWFLKKLEKIAPVVIIAGNHDLLENNSDRLDSITPMVKLLDDKDIEYYKESKCYEDNNIVWCVYSIFEGNARPDIETARIEYQNKQFIGLYHAPILGAKTEIGYEFDHGADLTQFDGLDAAMLGDIHMFQEFRYNDAPIVYPSSLIQQNFGESVTGHGFLEWDVDTLTYVRHEITTDYGFYKFKISAIDDIMNNKEKLVNK